jgi:hypothetical protein
VHPSTPHAHTNTSPEFNKAFTAQVGSNADASDARKNCQINLKLQFDPGFSFSVYQADFSGWGDLDAGVTGVVKSTYYFSGEQDQVRLHIPTLLLHRPSPHSILHLHTRVTKLIARQSSSKLTIGGPFHGKYYKQDDVSLAVWSPCGGDAMLNVNSEVALTPLATDKDGVLAATREGGRFTSNLYVQWKKC